MKIKLFDPICMPTKASTGDWYDLVCAEDTWVAPQHGHEPVVTNIPLGVAMELPKNKYAMIVPRSSTAKKHGIILANNVGIIDNAYNGPNDQWQFPAVSLLPHGSIIRKGTRIAQFHLFDCGSEIEFEISDLEDNTNRGGFGTTGD